MTNKHDKEKDIAIAIDFGETNIGLAFGRNGLVMPLKTIQGKNGMHAINEITTFVFRNKVDLIVMGLPLSYEGKETQMSRKVRVFAKLLKARIKKPVTFVDEHGSSQDSLEESIGMGLGQKSRRKIDHLSAAVILKNYYSHHE